MKAIKSSQNKTKRVNESNYGFFEETRLIEKFAAKYGLLVLDTTKSSPYKSEFAASLVSPGVTSVKFDDVEIELVIAKQGLSDLWMISIAIAESDWETVTFSKKLKATAQNLEDLLNNGNTYGIVDWFKTRVEEHTRLYKQITATKVWILKYR